MKGLKVLITTSGKESGLGNLTKYTNKTLLRVGHKPVISYIIESYPKHTNFIITLGHFGNLVKDFLLLAYPDRKFTFVAVDKYTGPGSSLGYSMLQAAPFLNSPFIFHASDTLVFDKIPPPTQNWIGGFRGQESTNYASFNILNNRIQEIMDKGIVDPDFLYIGLSGIKDYKNFWRSMNILYRTYKNNPSFSDRHVLNKIISEGSEFKVQEFKTWNDTGNIDALKKTREIIRDKFTVLDKEDEAIFIFDDHVIKFFADPQKVKGRVKKASVLKNLVPKIVNSRENFYKYKFVKGDLFADVANKQNFGEFLDWANKNLWTNQKEVSRNIFLKTCNSFYYTKTIERVDTFFKTRGIKDEETIINNEKIPSLKEIIKTIDFSWLSQGVQKRIHGDLILDNIIKTKNGFVLLDWREDFGGLLKTGDLYYDFAKLNHNLTLNHKIIMENQFNIEISNSKVDIDVLRTQNLIEAQETLYEFVNKNKYDLHKVKLLTAIVWLNMSPLHHHPFDIFLFYFGKINLWRLVNEK